MGRAIRGLKKSCTAHFPTSISDLPRRNLDLWPSRNRSRRGAHPISARTASQTSIAAALYCLAQMGIKRTVISHPDQFVEKLVPASRRRSPTCRADCFANHQNSSAFTGRELPLEMLARRRQSTCIAFAHGLISSRVYDSANSAGVLPSRFVARFILVGPSMAA